MARDRIKFRALVKVEVWTGKRESMERGRTGVCWPSSCNTDLESSESVLGGESGSMRIEGAWRDSRPAGDLTPSGSIVQGSIAAESPVGFKLPSSDLVVHFGSSARAVIGAANPCKIKSLLMSAIYFRFPNLI